MNGKTHPLNAGPVGALEMSRVAALPFAQLGVFVGAVKALCLPVARLESLEAPTVLALERALRATATGRTILHVSGNAQLYLIFMLT